MMKGGFAQQEGSWLLVGQEGEAPLGLIPEGLVQLLERARSVQEDSELALRSWWPAGTARP